MTTENSRVLVPASASALGVAKAADLAGFDAVVVPYDEFGIDSLTLGAHLLRHTRYVRVYVGLEPWVTTPQYAAKVSASLQRFSRGRLGWHFAQTGADVDAYVATAEAFWDSVDGLPAELSLHDFPEVIVGADYFDALGDPGAVLTRALDIATAEGAFHG